MYLLKNDFKRNHWNRGGSPNQGGKNQNIWKNGCRGVQRKLEEIEKNGNKFDGESLGGSSAKNDHRVPDLSPDSPPPDKLENYHVTEFEIFFVNFKNLITVKMNQSITLSPTTGLHSGFTCSVW